jgi:hypothetical protein
MTSPAKNQNSANQPLEADNQLQKILDNASAAELAHH